VVYNLSSANGLADDKRCDMNQVRRWSFRVKFWGLFVEIEVQPC